MFANLTSGLDFHSKALVLRADRQRILAGNIANADTPGFTARDLNFKEAMGVATDGRTDARLALQTSGSSLATTHTRHLGTSASANERNLGYSVSSQPSVDGNSVDLDRERANFADNAIRYESTLRFINGHSKTLLSAIQGQ